MSTTTLFNDIIYKHVTPWSYDMQWICNRLTMKEIVFLCYMYIHLHSLILPCNIDHLAGHTTVCCWVKCNLSQVRQRSTQTKQSKQTKQKKNKNKNRAHNHKLLTATSGITSWSRLSHLSGELSPSLSWGQVLGPGLLQFSKQYHHHHHPKPPPSRPQRFSLSFGPAWLSVPDNDCSAH